MKTSTTALTKTVRDGRAAHVAITCDPDAVMKMSYVAYLDGKQVGSTVNLARPRDLPAGWVATIGKLALTQDDVEQIQAVYSEVAATLPRDLRAERRSLVGRLTAAEGALTDARAAAQDEGRMDSHFTSESPRLQKAIDDAAAALEEFDAAHPEVAEEIRTERAAATEHRLLNY